MVQRVVRGAGRWNIKGTNPSNRPVGLGNDSLLSIRSPICAIFILTLPPARGSCTLGIHSGVLAERFPLVTRFVAVAIFDGIRRGDGFGALAETNGQTHFWDPPKHVSLSVDRLIRCLNLWWLRICVWELSRRQAAASSKRCSFWCSWSSVIWSLRCSQMNISKGLLAQWKTEVLVWLYCMRIGFRFF